MTDKPEPTEVAVVADQRQPIPPVNFDSTSTEDSTITAIAQRYLKLVGLEGQPRALLDLRMDLTACHLNGCALRLQDLLDAPDFALAHDIQGIERHLDRTTGKLGDPCRACITEGIFVPRFAEAETPTEQV